MSDWFFNLVSAFWITFRATLTLAIVMGGGVAWIFLGCYIADHYGDVAILAYVFGTAFVVIWGMVFVTLSEDDDWR